MHICLRFVVLFHYIAAAIFAATKIAASGSQSKQTHEMHCGLQNWFTPLTYTYLDCLLDVKMRGHKMAEI